MQTKIITVQQIVEAIRANRLLNQIAIQTIVTGWQFHQCNGDEQVADTLANHLEMLQEIIHDELLLQFNLDFTRGLDRQGDQFYENIEVALDNYIYTRTNCKGDPTHFMLGFRFYIPDTIHSLIVAWHQEFKAGSAYRDFHPYCLHEMHSYLLNPTDITTAGILFEYYQRVRDSR
jgi:hypothetical protein